jgi:hypothetical protein
MDMDENQDGAEDDDEVDDGEAGGEGWKGKGLEEIPKRPTMVSPYWSAVYGQYMLASHSYHGALCKYIPTLWSYPSYFSTPIPSHLS